MKARGQEFLKIPETYYESLKEKLKDAKIKLKEDFETVRIVAFFFLDGKFLKFILRDNLT